MTETDTPTIERHDLPSGAWVELVAPGRLKAKHHRTVMRALKSDDDRVGGQAVDLVDGVLAMLIRAWSVTGDDGEVLPIPSLDLDSIDELELEDYEALLAIPLVGVTTKRISDARSAAAADRVTPDDWDDESSPTAPSDAAKQRSRAASAPSSGRPGTPGATSRKTSGGRTASGGRRTS